MSDPTKQESDKEINENPSRSLNESLLVRLRLFLWPQHQPLIAGMLLLCLLGMSLYFVQRNIAHRGLIEIDRSDSLEANFLIDINQAGLGEIVLLPGVGEKLAQAIVEYRQNQGPFESFDGLQEVPGIGQQKLKTIIPYLAPIENE